MQSWTWLILLLRGHALWPLCSSSLNYPISWWHQRSPLKEWMRKQRAVAKKEQTRRELDNFFLTVSTAWNMRGNISCFHIWSDVPQTKCSFKYLGVNISEDLTWTTHIQTQVKKARQRLYHLRQLRKFRVSPAILKTFYSGAIESVLTQCISVWYGNSSNQDCKALQRVVRLAERISGSTLPSLQGIYIKRCKSRAAKILKDSNHPGNHLFCLLPSGRRFRSMMAKTERLRKSFFPQAIRLLNTNSVS